MNQSSVIVAAIAFAISANALLPAQAASKRSVDVTVKDQVGRTVSGLQQSSFVVRESGVRREITAFAQLQDEDDTVHYRLEFDSSTPSSTIDVVLIPPRGMPNLRVAWK